jgi:hypothetical protein
MTALAAAAAPSFPWGTVGLVVLILLTVYVLACAVWPWTSCGRCEGGRKRSPSGKAWRNCRSCGGTGKKVRLGRRMWTYLSDTNAHSK